MLTVGEVQGAAGITCNGEERHSKSADFIKKGEGLSAAYCKSHSRDDRSPEVGKRRPDQQRAPTRGEY